MKHLVAIMKWTGITIALAILTLVGFVAAAWLSPGNPSRSYLIAALATATVALAWRLVLFRLDPTRPGPADRVGIKACGETERRGRDRQASGRTIPGRMRSYAAIVLAVAAFGIFALSYSHAAAWRLPADERPWVDRTLAIAAAGSGTNREEYRRTTRPRLWHRPGQICVTLLTHRADGGGSYQACYDRGNGHLVEEREYGPCLCPEPLSDRLWELVW